MGEFVLFLGQQVAAKDTEIGTWSDWSVAVHATPWIEDPLPITSIAEVEFSTGKSTSNIFDTRGSTTAGHRGGLKTFLSLV